MHAIDRREAVKRIFAVAGVAVSAPTMAGILAGCQPKADGVLDTLSVEHVDVLAVMTEHIIPTTDTPGAREAGVPAYIDTMLSEFYPEESRIGFVQGLEKTLVAAEEALGQAFMDASSEDQLAFLMDLDEKVYPDLDAMSEQEREAYRAQRSAEGTPFFRRLKEMTIAGYYTSEVGATQELHVNPMGVYRADIPYSEIGKAWA